MQNRGTLYVGLLLVLAGLFFLAINLAESLARLGWRQLWPGLLLLAALAFYLPIFVWWERHRELSGLAVPGTIFLANALIFFYNTLARDWDAWRYLWSLEPVAVGLGLAITWLIGPRHAGLLTGAAVVGGIGLGLFLIFGSLFGASPARALAPIMLIGLGLLFLLRGVAGRPRPA